MISLVSTSKSNNIKCFKCLNKGHIASQCPNKLVHKQFLTEDDLLMVRCLMSAYVEEDDDSPRKNIFYSCCHVLGICYIIIDGGNSVNVASLTLVEKLNLHTLMHFKPYKLQWLNSKGEMAITK
ncbi:hypothetical protein CR513_07414, partial [Mucuna pruriens]